MFFSSFSSSTNIDAPIVQNGHNGKLELPEKANIEYFEPGIRYIAKKGAKLFYTDRGKEEFIILAEGTHLLVKKIDDNKYKEINNQHNTKKPKLHAVVYEPVLVNQNPNMPEFGREVILTHIEGFIEQSDLKEGSESFIAIKAPLFSNKISDTHDINQTILGDCFLLAAIGSILHASGDKYIENMIGESPVKQDEIPKIVVRLFHPDTHQPLYIEVDKTVLLENGYKNTVAHKQLWIHMIEKAYAGFGYLDKGDEKKEDYLKFIFPSLATMYGAGGKVKNAFKILTGKNTECTPLKIEENCKPKHPIFNLDLALAVGVKDSILRKVLEQNEEFEANHNNQMNLLKPQFEKDKANAECFKSFENFIQWSQFIYLINSDNNEKVNKEKDHPLVDAISNIKTQKECGAVIRALNQYKAQSKYEKFAPTIQLFCNYLQQVTFSATNEEEDNKKFLLPGEAKYTEDQLNKFKDIKEKIENNYLICASTCDKFKQTAPGLRPRHVYTVLGVNTKTIDDKKYHFVLLRNPWGSTGRKNKYENNVLCPIEIKEDPHCEVELNDFFDYFSSYTACEPVEGLKNCPYELLEDKKQDENFENKNSSIAKIELEEETIEKNIDGILKNLEQNLKIHLKIENVEIKNTEKNIIINLPENMDEDNLAALNALSSEDNFKFEKIGEQFNIILLPNNLEKFDTLIKEIENHKNNVDFLHFAREIYQLAFNKESPCYQDNKGKEEKEPFEQKNIKQKTIESIKNLYCGLYQEEKDNPQHHSQDKPAVNNIVAKHFTKLTSNLRENKIKSPEQVDRYKRDLDRALINKPVSKGLQTLILGAIGSIIGLVFGAVIGALIGALATAPIGGVGALPGLALGAAKGSMLGASFAMYGLTGIGLVMGFHGGYKKGKFDETIAKEQNDDVEKKRKPVLENIVVEDVKKLVR